jgi:lipoprotein-anchoring transpeptidase ErfK/SrfK
VENRPNGRLAWLRADSAAIALSSTPLALHADLSRRRLELRAGRRVLGATRVGVGRRGNPTPTGRFGVTDKLGGRPYGGVYGCCILALTGRQRRVPPGWRGGDRLAIHGTTSPGSLSRASSSGCLRAADRALRSLMRPVPVGAPVFIRE